MKEAYDMCIQYRGTGRKKKNYTPVVIVVLQVATVNAVRKYIGDIQS